MRIRSIKPEFWGAGEFDPYNPPAWKEIGAAPMGGTFIYRLYDSDGALLYVGITWNPWVRWRVHKKEKLWWGEVAFFDLHTCKDDRHARDWETWCIHNLNPLHNKHQNRRWHQRGKNQNDQARVLD